MGDSVIANGTFHSCLYSHHIWISICRISKENIPLPLGHISRVILLLLSTFRRDPEQELAAYLLFPSEEGQFHQDS